MSRVALVTGVGRPDGLGFEVVKQLTSRGLEVVLTARSVTRAQELASQIGGGVRAIRLDVTEQASVDDAVAAVHTAWGRLDILINNAAATSTYGERATTANLEAAQEAFAATFFGAWRTTKAFLPLLARAPQPRIVNVSSGAGSHGDPAFGLSSDNAMGPAYATAKAALNALTAALARDLAKTPIMVNAVCPGFTATFPGAEAMGARPVADGAASILWAAFIGNDGPRGGFFRDGQPVPW